MAQHNDLGKEGEKIAIHHLLQKGYQILEQNWRINRVEIDIIAMDEKTLVFLEVKTRSSNLFGEPASFVSEQKQEFMYNAAGIYMEQINHDWEVRFDIIGILVDGQGGYTIQHYEDAFWY